MTLTSWSLPSDMWRKAGIWAAQIKQGVKLDRRFGLSEMGPRKHGQT